jgi:hypothetical protein
LEIRRYSTEEKLLYRILICAVLIGISFFALAAMLGQLDSILAPWYMNPSNTWELPLPFIFNQQISSLLGWEIIYATIVAGSFAVLALAFVMGWSLKSLTKKQAFIPVATEDLWKDFENNLLDIEEPSYNRMQ